MTDPVPVVVLGGTGYVSGELLRLLAGHPSLRVAAVVSTSHAGAPVTASFPHLAGCGLDGLVFSDASALAPLVRSGGRLAVFAATPHGATAPLVDGQLTEAEAAGTEAHVVDLSADFRFSDPARFAAVYGSAHTAPHRLAAFSRGVPEHVTGPVGPHAAQPGCFVTAAVLAAYPAFALGLVEPDVFVSGVTGSSGSGRTPAANTHHPERRSTLYAYAPLNHRHEAEMRSLLGVAAGSEPDVAFVPHSGPFVRGIHATLRLTLTTPLPTDEVYAGYRAFYAGAPFVDVAAAPPKLTDVVGTNRARIGVTARGRVLVVTCVIDNLVKGSAGGGIQWMNRLLGLPEAAGLTQPGLGYL